MEQKTNYLDEYIEKVANLPVDVNRQLRQIKELDIQQNKNQRILESEQELYIEQLKHLKDKKSEIKKLEIKKKEIDRLQKECKSLSQSKMEVADQLYQIIDDAIKELEKDLKKFEQDLRNTSTQIDATKSGEGKLYGSSKKKDKLQQKLLEKTEKYKSKHMTAVNKMVSNTIEKKNTIGEWQIDPNEPKYCYCNKPSFGEMLKCDNPFCDKEWFHFECAGISDVPKGKWYCKGCQKVKKTQAFE